MSASTPVCLRLLRATWAIILLAPALCTPVAHAALPVKFTILSYHEISDRQDALEPAYTVTPANFEQQMQWLKDSGWQFVSMDDVLAEEAGKRELPDKAVLITFDDGYQSVYDNAFPILKSMHIPAVIALVGRWLKSDIGVVDFDGRSISRSELLSWREIREMTDSGLVEVASHSYDLHHGVEANPQHNLEPAATARRWLSDKERYEGETGYRQRVTADLRANNRLIRSHLGRSPRVIVWPYGRYNIETRTIAARLGMRVGLTLDDGPNSEQTPLHALRRIMVESGQTIELLDREIQLRNRSVIDDGHPAKVMHIDLDYIYDADPAIQEDNLGRLLERIVAIGVNTVYLQAYADPDGNGAAEAVYFPNRHLPMRADLLNRVAWQIQTRAPRVRRVYAWMPLLAWQLPAKDPAAHDMVVTLPSASNHLTMGYPRLSAFSPRARRTIREIYQDLGRSTVIDGILFHDDVTLSDYEDASPWAMKTYRKWGLPQSMQALRTDDSLLRRWAQLKTTWLDDFAAEMAAVVREEQPGLETARNLYASVALKPYSQTWYSQSLDSSLQHYDYTAIMAMPYMEQAPDPEAFLRGIFDAVAAHPGAMSKVVFELQSVNWRNNDQPLPGDELFDTIRLLYSWGVRNVGYYPDDLFHNSPDVKKMRDVLDSMPDNPQLSEILP
jgi:poly-beta-1,6-N-acetyl-D-glucosamine N-deacetylase